MLTDRFPAYSALLPLTTAATFAFPAALGSGISVWYHACAAWCMFEVLSRRQLLSGDRPMLTAAACFCIYCAVNLLAYAVNGVGTRYDAMVPLATLVLMPFLYSILCLARKAEVASAAVIGSMVGCYTAAAAALFQLYVRGIRPEGMAGNALVFAHVTTLAGGLCVAGMFMNLNRWRGRSLNGPLAGAFAAAVLAVLLSGSRIFWILLPLNGAVAIALSPGSQRRSFSRRDLAVGAAAMVALALLTFFPVSARLGELLHEWSSMEAGENRTASLGQRLELWRLGWKLFLEHPLIGYGTPSTVELIKQNMNAGYDIPFEFTHFHNGFLTAAVECGVLGLLAMLGAFVVTVAAALRALRRDPGPAERFGAAMLLLLVLTAALSGSFNIIIGHDILDAVLMMWLATGLYLAVGRSRIDAHPPRHAAS